MYGASLNDLAALYDAQDRCEEAEPLYQRALAIREQALGPVHPATATSLNNLAALYDAQGRYGEAEPLYRWALEIVESVLGPAHLYTATVRANYASLLKAMERKGLRLNIQAAIRRFMRWWGGFSPNA